jgi:hypothetical protein
MSLVENIEVMMGLNKKLRGGKGSYFFINSLQTCESLKRSQNCSEKMSFFDQKKKKFLRNPIFPKLDG